MQNTSNAVFSQRFQWMQQELLPVIEHEVGPLTEKLEKLAHLLDWVRVEDFVPAQAATGRPAHERGALANAFVAHALFNFPTRRHLIERLKIDRALRRLCGFLLTKPLPSESTFSRAFDEMARSQLASKAHQGLIRTHLGEPIIGHISRDSTAIEARETPQKTLPVAPTSVAEQRLRSPVQVLHDIPKACTRGTKKNANGYKHSWNGYKLHIDTADCGVPISALLSSAHMHDSLGAIPLSYLSAARVTNLYDLMDAGYCSSELQEHCRQMGHVPLIDHNPRRGGKEPFEPCDQVRYTIRTSVERTNARLKDEFGGRFITVRGAQKVFSHLMFGMLVLSADQLMRLRL